MTPFDRYKPFRNFIRQFPVEQSLVVVWNYLQHVNYDLKLPNELIPRDNRGRPIDLKNLILPWELEILARELVLHAGHAGTRCLTVWNEMARAINCIKELSEVMDPVEADGYDIMREMHRIAHRQFPWQSLPSSSNLTRYYKIYGGPELSPLVEREFQMTPLQLMHIAFGVSSRFLSHQGLLRTQSYEVIGITDQIRDAFIGRVSAPLSRLRVETAATQVYGRDWAYTYNPQRSRPLIAFDPAQPDRLLCPLPKFLHDRFTEGLFFDIVNQGGVENAYGSAYQRYVGEVLTAACPVERFKVIAEQPYRVGKNRKDGVDWILEDNSATLFIECKTKRMTHDAKFAAEPSGLLRDLKIMALYIAKHYANIVDAVDGKTTWQPTGRPLYALICTLEDWWLFNPTIIEKLDEAVRAEMTERNLDLDLLETIPYSIASIAEMEHGFQAIARVGVEAFFTTKNESGQKNSAMGPFLNVKFPKRLGFRGELFPEEFRALMPAFTPPAT